MRLASAAAAERAVSVYNRRMLGERYIEVELATFSELRASKEGKGAVKLCSFWAAGKCDRGASCSYYHDPAILQREAQQQLSEQLDHDTAMNLDAAHAAALLGKWTVCNKALNRAAKAEKAGEAASAKVDRGGSVDSKTALFQQMRRQELRLERQRITAFAEQNNTKSLKGKDTPSAVDLPDCLGRVFIFSSEFLDEPTQELQSDERVDFDSSTAVQTIRKRLFAALRKTMGLEEALALELTTKKRMRKRLKECVNKDGALCWQKIFDQNDCAKAGASTAHERPVRLEICAGNGDWCAAQAAAEKDVANWCAVELRHDRVYSIFSRIAFENLANMAAVGGDARRVVDTHVAAGSISHAFINFPEPPHHRSVSSGDIPMPATAAFCHEEKHMHYSKPSDKE
eukprot:SAG31_NODE_3853_length_3816_cov_1.535647_3_plen_400_part_00